MLASDSKDLLYTSVIDASVAIKDVNDKLNEKFRKVLCTFDRTSKKELGRGAYTSHFNFGSDNAQIFCIYHKTQIMNR